MALLQDISVQNMSDFEFYLVRPLKVKSNGAVGLPTYNYHVSNNNHVSNSHHVGVIATPKQSIS